ncbi:SDR family NAD(P)-dependent oxidoreductase [Vibrio sp. JC009]|uniref:SDR family NAD(P)-dependent oxidoreductase n=1 Tax=Vibrio sp. JC009 TaxID=2912314 RepID=UPI0023B15A5F|nr:SDR family NAD(P)-dependent oxidoreductase [Vibrio sp. JC009]WED24917.1 SDR family NAD(P)-dependent oxidoreductase [Vibrio sp. JC009]
MQKTILITGSTDGIGLETAKMLVSLGHHVLIHGRSAAKLAAAEEMLSQLPDAGPVESYECDLSRIADVEAFAVAVAAKHQKLDVLINNAGVYNVSQATTQDKLDVRFVVNTIAPYLLTQRLMPLLGTSARVVNLSSAAQAPVDLTALASSNAGSSDGMVYAQSKLAITMWSTELAEVLKDKGPSVVSVNPASMLGSKMVKEAYGVTGGDLGIGADILCRAALSEEFADASGKYFDNDSGRFAAPHPDALDTAKNRKLVAAIEKILAEKTL